MADNPRQFASTDSSGLGSYLTNRPPSSTSLGDPIDFEAINRQVINARTQPDYIYKESAVESTLRKQQDIAASLRIKQESADSKAANELQDQRNQAQRNELKNRVNNSPASEVGQPTPESSLNQAPPSSTPERQPPPSTGRPPPTPNGTSVRANALIEPTGTPGPAMLRERIPPPSNGFFEGLPRSLPQAAGRFAVPGVYAAADFGIRVYVGQPVAQAASGAVASATGAFAGGIVGTAIAGPIGGVVGAMVGGFVGGAASDYFFHPPPSTGSPPAEAPNYPPFLGGQAPGIRYLVTCDFDVYQKGNPRQLASSPKGVALVVVGPIQSLQLVNDTPQYNPGLVIIGTNIDGSPDIQKAGYGYYTITEVDNLKNIKIVRVDGKDDYYPDTTMPAPPPDNKPYYLSGIFPLNDDNTIPSGKPAAGLNKGKNRDVVPGIPANNTQNSTGAFFPGHGGLSPSSTPNPTQYASNLGGMLPGVSPTPAPPPFAEPKDVPPPRFGAVPGGFAPTPGGSANSNPGISVSGDPGVSRIENGVVTSPQILVAQPIPLGSSAIRIPSGSATTKKENPTPDGVSPTPKVEAQPTPKTPEKTAEKTSQIIQEQKKDFDKQIEQLTTIGGLIAGLTPILQGIPDAIAKSPTVQAANRATTQGAVCEIAQPGGCLGDALDNNANNINQNNNQNKDTLLAKINAGASAAQLALLELMNTKLGDLIPGGLSGKMERLSKWMHLDRVLNILIWWQTLHNAYMLSANLGQTLTSAISNVLAAIGIKDAEGSPLDIGEILGHQFDSLAKSVIGENEWGGMKKEYKKWNRIYQAAANLLNAVQSIGASILSALEIVGQWNAKVGNALKKYGQVGERAYAWMNPNVNFHNKYFTALDNVENMVSQIDSVASEVLSIEETTQQITTLKKEINDSLKEENNSKQKTDLPEAAKLAQKEKESKEAKLFHI